MIQGEKKPSLMDRVDVRHRRPDAGMWRKLRSALSSVQVTSYTVIGWVGILHVSL